MGKLLSWLDLKLLDQWAQAVCELQHSQIAEISYTIFMINILWIIAMICTSLLSTEDNTIPPCRIWLINVLFGHLDNRNCSTIKAVLRISIDVVQTVFDIFYSITGVNIFSKSAMFHIHAPNLSDVSSAHWYIIASNCKVVNQYFVFVFDGGGWTFYKMLGPVQLFNINLKTTHLLYRVNKKNETFIKYFLNILGRQNYIICKSNSFWILPHLIWIPIQYTFRDTVILI